MQIRIQDFEKNSFVLSIDKNRISIFKQIMNDNGLNINNVFDGFKDQNLYKLFINEKNSKIKGGAYNCSLGHTSLVKIAKMFNLPFICIFEDDAYPCIDVKLKLINILQNIPDDTDILTLGWSFFEKQPLKKSSLFDKINGIMHGSHAYIIFNKAYDRYLERYEYDPNTPSDLMMVFFKNAIVYKTHDPLFIQYNHKKSNWGCIGYVYEQNLKQKWDVNPPKNFNDVNPYLLIQQTRQNGVFLDILNKHGIHSKKDLLKINKSIDISSDKITIIGGSNSITTGLYGKYIDKQKIVLRINTDGIPDGFEKYTGKKTDIVIASEWHKTNNIIFKNNCQNKTLYLSMADIKNMNFLNYKFTTGFIVIMLMLCIFEKIELFGFGCDNDYSYKNNQIDSFHLINKIQNNCCHDVNSEHKILDYFINKTLKNRIIRGESIHPEIKS